MTYVIFVILNLWLICELMDRWQKSKKTLHYECYRKLYPNGYLDMAVGNARVDRAQPIGGLNPLDSQDAHNRLPPGTYRVGLQWDDEAKDYRATAQIATWLLDR